MGAEQSAAAPGEEPVATEGVIDGVAVPVEAASTPPTSIAQPSSEQIEVLGPEETISKLSEATAADPALHLATIESCCKRVRVLCRDVEQCKQVCDDAGTERSRWFSTRCSARYITACESPSASPHAARFASAVRRGWRGGGRGGRHASPLVGDVGAAAGAGSDGQRLFARCLSARCVLCSSHVCARLPRSACHPRLPPSPATLACHPRLQGLAAIVNLCSGEANEHRMRAVECAHGASPRWSLSRPSPP